MASSPKTDSRPESANRIIRGVEVQGVSFCGPKHEEQKRADDERNLKALEEFWKKKGFDDGQKSGYQKGLDEGRASGHAAGLEEGKKIGEEEGKKRGRDEGLSAGQKETKKELETSLALLQSAAQAVKDKEKAMLDAIKPQVLDLTTTIAGAVVGDILSKVPNFASLVESIYAKYAQTLGGQKLELVMHSSDLQKLVKHSQENAGGSLEQVLSALQVTTDDELQASSFSLKSSSAIVSFHRERILQELKELMSHD